MSGSLTAARCLEAGFTAAAPLDPRALEPMQEVRDMCRADRCRQYGRSWACPPACGTLEEWARRLRDYAYGFLLQVTEQMEDDYDVEAMERAETRCKAALDRLADAERPLRRRLLPLTAGGCRRCKTCTYPDAPCRHPAQMTPSLEACGLLVSRECERAGLPYYYGPRTITFTAAVLVDD